MSEEIDYNLQIPAVTDLRPLNSATVSCGVKNADYRTVKSLSGDSSSSMEFQLTCSTDHLIGSQIHIDVPIQLTVTAKNNHATDALAHPLKSKNTWAWSQFALYQAIERIQVTFNGQSYERRPSDFINYIAPFIDCSTRNPAVTSLLATPDTVTTFTDLYSGTNPVMGVSPFGESKYHGYDYYLPRHAADEVLGGAGYTDETIAKGGTSKSATVAATLPLYLPFDFFDYGESEKPALANITNMSVSITFNNKWERMLSMITAAGVTVTDVSCDKLTGTPSLYYQSYCIYPTTLSPRVLQAPLRFMTLPSITPTFRMKLLSLIPRCLLTLTQNRLVRFLIRLLSALHAIVVMWVRQLSVRIRMLELRS